MPPWEGLGRSQGRERSWLVQRPWGETDLGVGGTEFFFSTEGLKTQTPELPAVSVPEGVVLTGWVLCLGLSPLGDGAHLTLGVPVASFGPLVPCDLEVWSGRKPATLHPMCHPNGAQEAMLTQAGPRHTNLGPGGLVGVSLEKGAPQWLFLWPQGHRGTYVSVPSPPPAWGSAGPCLLY